MDEKNLREQIARAVRGAIDSAYTFEGDLDPEVDGAVADAVMPFVSDALAAVEERATILMKDAADRIGREHSSYGCIGCNLCTVRSVLEGYDERDDWIAEAQDRIDARLAAVEAERMPHLVIALDGALYTCACPIVGDHPVIEWPPGHLAMALGEVRAALATAEAERDAARAEAWDEGFEEGATWHEHINGIPNDPPLNPYRKEHLTMPENEGANTLTGAERIAAERARQRTEEGYDDEHDRGHAADLVNAAECYARDVAQRLRGLPHCIPGDQWSEPIDRDEFPWPWAAGFWKPTDDPIRDLAKAGALIAAAIDSLLNDDA